MLRIGNIKLQIPNYKQTLNFKNSKFNGLCFDNWALVLPTRSVGVVEEHFVFAEALAVRRSGGYGRENVGMSNLTSDAKSDRRKSKVSVAMAIIHGLGDPKAMARAVADG